MTTGLFLNRTEIRYIRKKIGKYAWARDLYRRVQRNARGTHVGDKTEEDWAMGHLIRDKALVYAIGGDDSHVAGVIDALRKAFSIDEPGKPLDDIDL